MGTTLRAAHTDGEARIHPPEERPALIAEEGKPPGLAHIVPTLCADLTELHQPVEPNPSPSPS